jgi:glycosyltransferase involved in cell wall biosynthesis
VLDTGSEDSTLTMLEEMAKVDAKLHVFDALFLPFRFDIARNFILEQVKKQAYDYAVFLDADEVLEEGWCNKLKSQIAKNQAHGINFRMVFEEDAAGTPTCTYNRLMCHQPNAYRWHYPAHEVLVYTVDNVKEDFVDIKVYHRPDQDKEPADYLPLLKMGYDENQDARSAYYFARELFYEERYEEAFDVGYKAYGLQDNYLQKAEIAYMLGHCHENMGSFIQAQVWFTCACMEAPDIRETWHEAVRFYMRNGRYYAALGCIENMLAVQKAPEHSIIRHDNLYREIPYHNKALCLEALGWESAASIAIQKAFSLNNENHDVVRDMIRIQKIPVKNLSPTKQDE